MANHARVWHCKKQFDTKKIKQTLEVFNKEHLFGLFKVWHDDDNFSIYFNDNNNPLIDENSFVIGQGFWIDRDENHLEFRHGHHGRTFDWWLDTALEYYLANVFDGQINDEGVGYVRRRKTIPTLKEYYESVWRPYRKEWADAIAEMKRSERESLTMVAPALLNTKIFDGVNWE